MPYKNDDIEKVLPENKVHWKLIFCPKRRLTHNEYRISIELNDRKRQYTCVCFDELCKLLQEIPLERRCFYEHISRDDSVKFFLDYEYCRTEQNAIVNVDKALLCIRNLFVRVMKTISNNDSLSSNDMLLLESSSAKKESYHLIFTDKKIRFCNTHSLRVLISEIFRVMLLDTINHECFYERKYKGDHIDNESNLSEMIDAFHSVRLEWFSCFNCKTKHLDLHVSDICNLFVCDEKGHLIPCIDLKVYGIEQDFRMFMCTKIEENRPFVRKVILNDSFEFDIIQGNHC